MQSLMVISPEELSLGTENTNENSSPTVVVGLLYQELRKNIFLFKKEISI